MSASDSPPPPARTRKIRRDGWTPERQLRFLEALACTRRIAEAVRHASMSRESAYRLRDRREGALFALLWDRILAPASPQREGHSNALTDGQLMRLLSNHYRRERGDFLAIGSPGAKSR